MFFTIWRMIFLLKTKSQKNDFSWVFTFFIYIKIHHVSPSLLSLCLGSSWGVWSRWGRHVDSHYRGCCIGCAGAHRDHGLPYWQEKKSCGLPDHLTWCILQARIVGTTDFCSHLDSTTPLQLQLPSLYPALPSADVSPAIAQVALRFLDFLLYYGIIHAYLMVQVKIKNVFEALGHAKVLFPGTRLSLSLWMPGVCCYLCLIRVRKHMICLVPHILTFNLMRLFI